MDDKIDTKTAATILGLSRRTVYDLIKSGKIAAEKFGRDYAISLASVRALAERRARKRDEVK